MTNKRAGNSLSLLVESFERYGLVEGFGVLRFAQDDSKNKTTAPTRAAARTWREKVYIPTHRKKRDGWDTGVFGLGREDDGEVQGSGAMFRW
jgi:hypothetical protein